MYKQMVEVFRSLGVEAVAGVGSPFDPEVPVPADTLAACCPALAWLLLTVNRTV